MNLPARITVTLAAAEAGASAALIAVTPAKDNAQTSINLCTIVPHEHCLSLSLSFGQRVHQLAVLAGAAGYNRSLIALWAKEIGMPHQLSEFFQCLCARPAKNRDHPLVAQVGAQKIVVVIARIDTGG